MIRRITNPNVKIEAHWIQIFEHRKPDPNPLDEQTESALRVRIVKMQPAESESRIRINNYRPNLTNTTNFWVTSGLLVVKR